MTIETKMVKPVKDMNLDEVNSITKEYRLLSELLEGSYVSDLVLETTSAEGYLNSYLCENEVLKYRIRTALERQLENLEIQLNWLGYTMQDEPKEWRYHVNVLRGEDDDR